MSRIVLVSLASLVAAAALTLHDSSTTQRPARVEQTDGSAAHAVPASAPIAGGDRASIGRDEASQASRSPTQADRAASRTPSSPSHTASPPSHAAASTRASPHTWSSNVVLAAFAGGVACTALLAWLAFHARHRLSLGDAFGMRRTEAPATLASDAGGGEWQMLDSDESDLVSLHDADGVVRYASPALLELIGYSRQELIGRQGRELVHEDDLPTLLAAVHAARSEANAPPALLRVREKSGRLVWIEAEFRHSISRTGEPEMLCVGRSVARSARPQPSRVAAPAGAGTRVSARRATQLIDEGSGPSLQDLCHAFERREFELHYQPKMALAQGTVTGVEALLRWSAPEGSGRTAEIIASAERTGFIVTLGEWVLRAAAHQSLQWRKAGLRYPVAVNVSAVQLHDPRFVPLLRELVVRDPELPFWLELEVTEQALSGDSDRAVRTIAQIVALGFRLHVDDFGTGYSNLAQLSRMPVRALKIDRSIVHELATGGGSDGIVDAVVSLSRALRMKVIAEGVETAEQLERLRASGCDEAQGFLFSHPMSADAVRTLVLPSPLASSPASQHAASQEAPLGERRLIVPGDEPVARRIVLVDS